MTDRDLLIRVRAALALTFTTAGHVAQRVEYERLGYCSWRGCARICQESSELFLDLDEMIGDGEAVAVEVPQQGSLFESEVAG